MMLWHGKHAHMKQKSWGLGEKLPARNGIQVGGSSISATQWCQRKLTVMAWRRGTPASVWEAGNG